MVDILIYMGYIIVALLILLLMITIHEFGHYIAGKILKFKINEFSIGFGPKLFFRKRKSGEIFSIRAIPLGGFCAFEGEDQPDEEAQDIQVFQEESTKPSKKITGIAGKISGTAPKSDTDLKDLKKFNDQAPWKRIIVLFAGGAFNLLSAIIFSFIFILAVGLPQPKVALLSQDEFGVSYITQLNEGDVITHANGKSMDLNYLFSGSISEPTDFESVFQIALAGYNDLGDELTLTVRQKDGEIKNITLKKQLVLRRGQNGEIVDEKFQPILLDGQPIFDISDIDLQKLEEISDKFVYESKFGLSMTTHLSRSFKTAITRSVPFTLKMSWMILSTLGKLLTGQLACNTVSGPVGTVVGIAQNASVGGWQYLLLMLPLIAANLGVFNLLPIPALDGSKILFALIEWIRKKPINRNVEAMIHAVGLLVLLGLVIIVDISGLFSGLR